MIENSNTNEEPDVLSGDTNEKINKALEQIIEEVENSDEETDNIENGRTDEVDVEKIINKNNTHFRNLLNEEQNIFLDTDKEFLKFLRNFVENQKAKENQKTILMGVFFAIVMLGFFVLIITPLALVSNLSNINQITAIVSMIAILIELVSAIIILPEIIAKYLFNKEEDSQLMQIIESMQRYNQKKHDYISGNRDDL